MLCKFFENLLNVYDSSEDMKLVFEFKTEKITVNEKNEYYFSKETEREIKEIIHFIKMLRFTAFIGPRNAYIDNLLFPYDFIYNGKRISEWLKVILKGNKMRN